MHFYLIAGEASGDLLGARLMLSLKKLAPAPVFTGIGGPQMEAAGLSSRIPMAELSLMGFVEILPHIPRLRRHIRHTVRDILKTKPDIVVTIDSPGFNFRVVKALRKRWPKGHAEAPRIVHYVAPSVWAYKPGRAKKLARMYDDVLTLLPFEPPYFTNEGMSAHFVGHPLVEQPPQGHAETFRKRKGIEAASTVISVLPGSRMGELTLHLPTMRETVQILKEKQPDLVTLMPAVPHLREAMEQMTADWPTRLILIDQGTEKWDAFAASDLALAKSGTVTLELALAGTPMVVMYKVHPLSAWLMRKMMLSAYVTLVNVLLNREVIPELLQEDATPNRLATEALTLLQDNAARQQQKDAFAEALVQLGLGGDEAPSQKAAAAILGAGN